MSLVRAQRHRVGMTQARLSQLTGLDDSTISKIETGVRKLTVDEVVKIARALDCPPSALLPSLEDADASDAMPKAVEHV